ncbi:hypothetical protein OPKNFCMD_4815 [Methylobacterium crusticola]|uniref:Uncharacterized protein n=1 Tax=Methylobacterium crusticola TaxID=1697972 RepID=A0ABQ4R3B5_9HYPH|nr:hypothetical protein [Methylobacterium crusticola]GJD52053.1 hypothetical protein OPKNFCMD_4815 [Methylobacterium crusticola]
MGCRSFREPVVVWLDPKHPEFGIRCIETVTDGLAALHRYDLGSARHGPSCRFWNEAAGALVRARAEPTADNIDRAHLAFERLVAEVAPVPPAIRRRVTPRSLLGLLTA